MDGIAAASHRLCEALHGDFVDPAGIEIHLPQDAWWRLWNRLEQQYRGLMVFDGRGSRPDRFQWMGITYVVKRM